MAEEHEERQFNSVSLDESGLPTGEKSRLDPNADAWEFPPPPPKGTYNLQLFPASQGSTFRMGYLLDDNGNEWTPGSKPDKNSVVYSANIEARVRHENPDWDGAIVFPRGINTRLRRGSDISTMAALLQLCGWKIPEDREVTPLQLAKLLDKVLKKDTAQVIKGVYLDWQIRYQNANGDWVTAYSTYDDFPDDGKGGKRHIVRVAKPRSEGGGSEEMRARLYIKEWPKVNKPAKGPNQQQTITPEQPTLAPSSDEEELSL